MSKKAWLFTLLFYMYLGVFAQRYQVNIIPDVNVINIHTPEIKLRAALLENGKKGKLIDEKWYSWYKSGEIHVTQGFFQGQLLHGDFKESYNNNSLKAVGKYYKGLKDGKWMQWDENGTLRKVSHWTKGNETGPFKLYSPKGKLIQKGNMKNGFVDGVLHSFRSDSSQVHFKKFLNGGELIDWKANWRQKTLFRFRRLLN